MSFEFSKQEKALAVRLHEEGLRHLFQLGDFYVDADGEVEHYSAPDVDMDLTDRPWLLTWMDCWKMLHAFGERVRNWQFVLWMRSTTEVGITFSAGDCRVNVFGQSPLVAMYKVILETLSVLLTKEEQCTCFSILS